MRKAQEISEVAKCGEAIGVVLGYSEYRGPSVRWKDGAMEWLDNEDSQWSESTHLFDVRNQILTFE